MIITITSDLSNFSFRLSIWDQFWDSMTPALSHLAGQSSPTVLTNTSNQVAINAHPFHTQGYELLRCTLATGNIQKNKNKTVFTIDT